MKGWCEMTITFYNNASDRKMLDKNITVVKAISNAKIINETDIINPTILISRSFYDQYILKANYIFIDSLKRYYYINNRSFVESMVQISCSVDVLMSYKNEIRNITCTVSRNQNLKNGYLNDDNYNIQAYKQVVCKMYPNAINNDSIILMTAG